MVSWLLNKNVNLLIQDDDGWTPLIAAIAQYHLDTALLLLESKRPCGVDILTNVNSSVLNYLCETSPVGIQVQYMKILKTLLESGCDPHRKNDRGSTPIHSAVIRGNVDVVRELLKYVTRVDIVDGDGLTPLHIAIDSEQCNIGVVNALLDKGFSATADSPIGTPLQIALSRRHIGAFKYMLTKLRICYFDSKSEVQLSKILKYLSPKECLKMRCVSKLFRSAVVKMFNSDEYWNAQHDSSKKSEYKAIVNVAKEWFFTNDSKKSSKSGRNSVNRDSDIAMHIALVGDERSGKTSLIKMFNETPPKFMELSKGPTEKAMQPIESSNVRIFGLHGKLVKVTLTEMELSSENRFFSCLVNLNTRCWRYLWD